METVGLIERIASGDLTEDEQLALLAQVETSIQLRKQAKQVQDELESYDKAVEVISQTINDHKDEVDKALKEVYSYVRQPGPAGKDGKQGKDGRDGLQGLNGKDGRDGKDGQDGLDGKDGASIVDVYWAADGSLVCVLSDGREIDTGPLITAGTKGETNVSVSQWAGYSSDELKKTFVYNTFETTNKNLAASGAELTYNVDGDLTTVTYDNGIVKTLNYDVAGNLTSVILSGNTPEGIDLTKTFVYNVSDDLISFSYS